MKFLKKNNYTYSFSYLHSFLIPLIVMIVGCIGCGIFPFGNQSFLRNDLYNQYMPFFQAFHDKIWQGESLAYSFELGLGSGFAALYGYYLASPVNWLVALCPRSLIAEFITIVILIKVALAGSSFAFYLAKRYHREDMGILMFSTAYALSGFMAAYQWNIMWLDVVVLAPLVLWAMEELIYRGKGSRYCLLLACSIFTNFYLSIMLCIFLVLYFVMLILWEPWRVFWRRCIQFGFYSLLAGGMAAAMLLPVYFALSGTEFHEFDFPDTFKWYMNFLEELSRHCMNVSMKLQADHWPNVYSGVAMFFLVPLFVLNRRISVKSKVIKIFLMTVFLFSFAANMPDFIWHGFNYPDSLPGRQTFLYSWLLLVMGYEVYIRLKWVRLYEIIAAAIVGYGIVIAAWIWTDVEGMNVWTYVLTLLFMTLYLALLVGKYAWNYPRVREWVRMKLHSGRKGDALKKCFLSNRYLGIKIALLVLVVAELACNTYLTSIRTVNRTKYMAHFTDAEGSLEHMKERDRGLYRTEIFDRLTKNDGMMWDIHTATVFSSTINANVVDWYENMGMGTTRVSYWHQGATPLVSAMLGVKYMLGEDDGQDNDLYDIVYSNDTGALYRCNYTLPIGYVLDPKVEEEWEFKVYNPIKAQNAFCRLLGVKGDLLVPKAVEKVDERHYTVTASGDEYIYIYLGKNSLSEVKYTLGEEKTTFKQVSFDYLLDLGFIENGNTAELEVVEEDEEFKTFKAYVLNLRVLEEAIKILSRDTLEVTEHTGDSLKGQVTLEEAGKLVISIPADKGWRLYVNGEEREIETFEETFLAVSLEQGTHEIALEFHTPGVKAGLAISAVCIILWVICYRAEWSGRRKKNL